MKAITTIMKKEMLSYFNSAIAYIFLTLFLTLLSFMFFRVYFLIGVVRMGDFFSILPWIFLIFIPAITMKSWAEEKGAGTLEVLFTMPIKDTNLVLGKFFSGVIFISIGVLLTLIVPTLVGMTGNLDWGTVVASYIGTLFLAASYIAVGNFVSSLTSSQISAFLLTAVTLFFFLIIGTEPVYSIFPSAVAEVIRNFSLSHHFHSIGRGIVDSRDIVFYISFISLFLFYNVKSLESRKW